MQFVVNGPDIPDSLLQAHEEGRVIFFCGAGISYPAGLPSFKKLVVQIYKLTGTDFQDIEKTAFKGRQYDATLNQLERRIPGQRMAVRNALAQALKPKLRRKDATDTHEALLRLGRSREGTLRLVTTNFDRVFHVAAKRTNQTFQTFVAPMLPVPKNSRWDGLVYLHGLLPEKNDDTALNRLVVTSGDFGLAYLTERWAARFVSELFRNYVVCFVGINDPVLRYMMDALAADRMLGEVTPQAWALVGYCEARQKDGKIFEWEAKGVKPILYKVSPDGDDHSALHKTLQIWADTYRDGVQGKEAIVVKHALTRPQNSTQQDNFIGRMLWALSDKSGLPAKRFADFNPVPSLEWLLGPFTDKHFCHNDLYRFQVSPDDEVDTKLHFSLIQRPAPYTHTQPMFLASGVPTNSQWDAVMFHLARWLLRHLDDPKLIFWVAKQGGQLHSQWRSMIEQRLDELALWEREEKTSKLDAVRLHSPKAIPGPGMRNLWRLLISGRIKSPWPSIRDLYSWNRRLKLDGLTTILRLELRELLAPKVVLKKPWDGDDSNNTDKSTLTKRLIDWELVLASDNVHSAYKHLIENKYWEEALPKLTYDFQQLLADTLDIQDQLNANKDFKEDTSYFRLPSISPHEQNRFVRDWIILIEFLRDSWLEVYKKDRAHALRVAQSWFALPYPVFKRLAFFAASQDECISPEQWVEWLLTDDAWWLWSTNTRREVCRLFVLQGKKLTGTAQERLEAALLASPSREHQYEQWLRLAKLKASGLALGATAAARLEEISNEYPQWQLTTSEREEFSFWTGSTSDSVYTSSRDVDIAPRKRKELVVWLAKPFVSGQQPTNVDDGWSDVCRTRFFHSSFALCDLAQDDVWPADRWRTALQVWAQEGMVLRSWHYTAPLVQTMPDDVLQEIVHSVTFWMEAASKSIQCHEDILLRLCHRVFKLPIDADTGILVNHAPIDQPVYEAINHPVGHVTMALVNLWFKQNPNDDDLLPTKLKPIFSKLCDVQVDRFRHGRVLLSSQLVAFFRVDRRWTEQYLLPLFDWSKSIEAKAVWQGFLSSPHLYQPLLTAFKSQFLDTAKHYAELGEYRQQFAFFLTYAALEPIEGYTIDEFHSAIGALPQEGLEESAQALCQALEGAADQSEEYWKNRVLPFWQQIWPKSYDLATSQISDSLIRLIIAARGEFPEALDKVQDWLKPIEYSDYAVNLLYESGLCRRFSKEALFVLFAVIIINHQQWPPQKLRQCLNEIVHVVPNLAEDNRYKKLDDYLRMYDQ